MAITLPTAQNLGGSDPLPQSPTNIIQPGNPDAIGKATSGFGQSVTQLGGEVKQVQDAQDTASLAAAKSKFLTAQVAADAAAKIDPNYGTLTDRYTQNMQAARDSALASLPNDQLKNRFMTEMAPQYQRGISDVSAIVNTKTGQQAVGDATAQLDSNDQAILQAPDESTRAQLMNASNGVIDGLVAKGYMTPEAAVTEKRTRATNISVQRVEMMSPTDQLNLLRPTGAAPGVLGTPRPAPAGFPAGPATSNTAQPTIPQTTSVNQIAQGAADATGVDPQDIATTAMIESNGKPDAYNPSSKARGMFQITPGTAQEWGVKDPSNPQESALKTAQNMKKNTAALAKTLGQQPSGGQVYLAHQQGLAGAKALLTNPDANAVDVLAKFSNHDNATQKVVENGGTPSMTAGQFAQMWVDQFDQKKGALFGAGSQQGVQVASNDPSIGLSQAAAQASTDAAAAGDPSQTPPGDPNAVTGQTPADTQVASTDPASGQQQDVNALRGAENAGNQPLTTGYDAQSGLHAPLPTFTKTGTWVDFIPYDKRIQLIREAESQSKQDKVVNRQILEIRTKDSNSMAQQGKQDAAPLAYTDFQNAYDETEAPLRWAEYLQNQKSATNIHSAILMPATQQQALLNASKPQAGPGFAQQQTDYQNLQEAITKANDDRNKDPIAWARQYGMANATPMDLSAPHDQLTTQLQQRAATGTQMKATYGTPLKVFTDSEASNFSNYLNTLPADKRLSWLQTLQSSIGQTNTPAYVAAVNQLRPGSPVTAVAGYYTTPGISNTVDGTPGFFSTGTTRNVTGQSVAIGMLKGEDLISPAKTGDGGTGDKKPTMPMPADGQADLGGETQTLQAGTSTNTVKGSMRQDFQAYAGNALGDSASNAYNFYQATRAYYANLMAQKGDYSGKYDAATYHTALQDVIGNTITHNDKTVIAPWGMGGSTFNDKLQAGYNQAAKAAGYDTTNHYQYGDVTFQNAPATGWYYVNNGNQRMVDKQGKFLLVRVTR